MPLSINFADVGDVEFNPVPRGKYVARVTGGEIRVSGENAKNPGSEYINWEFTISEGEFEDRKLWSNTSLLPQALFGLKRLLASTGKWGNDDLEGELDFEIDDLLGEEVGLSVAIKQYNSEDRNEIKSFMPADKAREGGTTNSSMLP